jgi:hypothetical protein
MSKRDVVFLVADGGMQQMLVGFFGRAEFHKSLGCGRFRFDPAEDIFVHPRHDPGVYREAREFLRPFERLHERVVVILDAAWDGTPGAEVISADLTAALSAAWEHVSVVVIEPELEAWLWQENPNVARALRCGSDMRELLAGSGHWPRGKAKPADPKAALKYLQMHHSADGSRAAFRRLAETVSIRRCQDPAFCRLRDAICAWFPEEP